MVHVYGFELYLKTDFLSLIGSKTVRELFVLNQRCTWVKFEETTFKFLGGEERIF